jgi:hypothetical protein
MGVRLRTFATRRDVRLVLILSCMTSNTDRMVIVSIARVTVTNSRGKVLLQIAPNEYPATRYLAKRDSQEDAPVEFIQVQWLSQRLHEFG